MTAKCTSNIYRVLRIEWLLCLCCLGEIEFKDNFVESTERCEITQASRFHLQCAAALLGFFSTETLEQALIMRTYSMDSEVVKGRYSKTQAVHIVDGLAKSAYKLMTDWLVKRINTTINQTSRHVIRSVVSILDIFGFENSSGNSLEQLCINYTNEALQLHFNQVL